MIHKQGSFFFFRFWSALRWNCKRVNKKIGKRWFHFFCILLTQVLDKCAKKIKISVTSTLIMFEIDYWWITITNCLRLLHCHLNLNLIFDSFDYTVYWFTAELHAITCDCKCKQNYSKRKHVLSFVFENMWTVNSKHVPK